MTSDNISRAAAIQCVRAANEYHPEKWTTQTLVRQEEIEAALSALPTAPPAASEVATTPGERGEAVEALLAKTDEREMTLLAASMPAAAEHMRKLATALREAERLRKAEVAQRDEQWAKRKAAESDRDALRAQLTDATSALAKLHSEHAGAVAMNRAAEGAIATLETKLTEATARAERLVAGVYNALGFDKPPTTGTVFQWVRREHEMRLGLKASAEERTEICNALGLASPAEDPKAAARALREENAALRHELNTLRQRDASKSRAELHEEHDKVIHNLAAEREAHEETRATVRIRDAAIANWKRTADLWVERAERAEQRCAQLTTDVKALRELVEADVVRPEAATLEAVPDLGEPSLGADEPAFPPFGTAVRVEMPAHNVVRADNHWREELGRVVWRESSRVYGLPAAPYENEVAAACQVAAEAVARRVVQRVRAAVRSEADACDVSDWQGSYGGAIMHAFDDAVAALSVAIGDLGADPTVEEPGSLIAEYPSPDYLADCLRRVNDAPSTTHNRIDRHEAWVVESIQRLEGEVSRLRGGR